MKRKLLWLFPVLAAGLSLTPVHAQDYEHLTITSGLTADVIANGVGSAMTSTTMAVDNANFAFMATDFQATASSIAPAYALPASGLIASAPSPGLTYQLAPYSGNNSLRIATANTSGTLVFSNQVSATKLYLLATTGSGTATITGTITFSDATTQAITSSVIPDWFFSTALPVAASGFGRVNRTNNVMENPAGDPRLYQLAINILPANQAKMIASVTFTKTSTAEGILNIFAITAELLGGCPSPTGVTSSSTATSGTVDWTAPVVLPAIGYEYYYSTSATLPVEATTPSGSVAVGTNTVTIPSLPTGQQYYVWIRSNCGASDKGPWVMTTFTTGQVTATYTMDDISTLFNETPTVTSTTTCPGTLSVTVPAGYEITSVSTAYTMTTASNGWKSEQRSLLVCTTTNTAEASVTAGVGGTGGTMAYNRTGLNIADGATGTVNFELRAWRTYGGAGCNLTYNKVDNNSWTVTITYAAVCVAPAVPTATAQEVCATATISDLTATGAAGATFNWYSSMAATTPLASTAAVSAGTYYVSQTVNLCESDRIPVVVTINIVPEPTFDATQNFCAGALASELTAEGEAGGTIVWSTTPGGAALSATTPLIQGTYYVWQMNDGCTSEINDVIVSINSLSAPIVSEFQVLCSDATIADIIVEGNVGATFEWSLTEGGTVLTPVTQLQSGTYYVRQLSGNCASDWIMYEVILEDQIPPVVTDTDQILCSGSTIENLDVESIPAYAINWSLTAGGSSLAPGTLLVDGTYYVSQTSEYCESPLVAVTVTVNDTPAAPAGNGTQQFTTGETVGDLDIVTETGSLISWFIMNDGGVFVSVNTETALVNNETYYVQQTLNGCESEFLAIQAQESLGTQNFTTTGFKAYPNPVSDVLNVRSYNTISEIAIYNLLGQKVLMQKANEDTVQVNVSKLEAGTYLLQVTTLSGEQSSMKIVKQ